MEEHQVYIRIRSNNYRLLQSRSRGNLKVNLSIKSQSMKQQCSSVAPAGFATHVILLRNGNMMMRTEKSDSPIHLNTHIIPKKISSISLGGKIPAALAALGMVLMSKGLQPAVAAETELPLDRPVLYGVSMTNPPCLVGRTVGAGEDSFLNRVKTTQVTMFGLHKDDLLRDSQFQESLINRLMTVGSGGFLGFGGQSKRELLNSDGFDSNIAIGLEFIPSMTELQNAFDDYVLDRSKIPIEDADRTLESYLSKYTKQSIISGLIPVFHVARNQKQRLVPLGVPDVIANKLQTNGLSGLTKEERQTLVPSAEDFISSTLTSGFQRYNEKVIANEYNESIARGEIPTTVTADNYYSYRIFTDEAVAYSAAKFATDNIDTTLLLLANVDRTKFGYGVEERLKRILGKRKEKLGIESKKDEVISVILNPRSEESLSYTRQLNLALSYGDQLPEARPFADFIWFDKTPKMRFLTRIKNPISKEGDKPDGEDSVLGVFKSAMQ